MVFALTLLSLVGLAWALGFLSPQRRRSFRRFYPRSRARQTQAPAAFDAGQQLSAVMAASFEKQRVLSGPEYRVFRVIEKELAATHRGYRVFGQTSLGEILQSPSTDAFRAINSKRADILVIDPWGWPVLAVEYQGEAHYQGTAAARDAIKKEALRKAGVRHIEVSPSDSDEQIRYRLREQLGAGAVVIPIGQGIPGKAASDGGPGRTRTCDYTVMSGAF